MAPKLLFFAAVLCFLLSQCYRMFTDVTLKWESVDSLLPFSVKKARWLPTFHSRPPLKEYKPSNDYYISDLKKAIHDSLKAMLPRSSRYENSVKFRPLDGILNTISPFNEMLHRKNETFYPLKKFGSTRSFAGTLINLLSLRPPIGRLGSFRPFNGKLRSIRPEKTIPRIRRLLDGLNKRGLKSKKPRISRSLKAEGRFKNEKPIISRENETPTAETRKGLFGRLGQKPLLKLRGLKTGGNRLGGLKTGGNRLGGLKLGGNRLGRLKLDGNKERKQRLEKIASQLSDPQTIPAVADVLVAGMIMTDGGYRRSNESPAASAMKPPQALRLELGDSLLGSKLFGKPLLFPKHKGAAKQTDNNRSSSKVKRFSGNTKATRKATLLSRTNSKKLARLQDNFARKFGHKIFKAKRKIFGGKLPTFGGRLSRWPFRSV